MKQPHHGGEHQVDNTLREVHGHEAFLAVAELFTLGHTPAERRLPGGMHPLVAVTLVEERSLARHAIETVRMLRQADVHG